ncbi:MAG: hypothetical protein IJ225_00045 [Solobacterium sp.]|nr:hypothetical protein [Solobacterium sp.]
MAVTYIKRKRGELNELYRRSLEADLVRKADLISAFPDPDHLFHNYTILTDQPFGVLVLFRDQEDLERFSPQGERCDDLDCLERLITKLQNYPAVRDEFFEEKRQAYLQVRSHYRYMISHPANTKREQQRLESEVKHASTQRAWLEKENTGRMERIRSLETEIERYETILEHLRSEEDNTSRIEEAVEETRPLKLEIDEDTVRLNELAIRIEELRKEQELIDQALTPTTFRLQEQEEQRLTGEHDNLISRIEDNTAQLKQIEQRIEALKEEDRSRPQEDEVLETLGKSRERLEQVQGELDGGNTMVSNLNLKVEILAARLKSIKMETERLPEQQEGAYIAMVARAEELLNAWISCSKKLKRILEVDGISARELLEAVFFAYGPLCSLEDGCQYLDSTEVSLDTLLLYRTEEERAGFQHVYNFE